MRNYLNLKKSQNKMYYQTVGTRGFVARIGLYPKLKL